jgi:hypothetical protein
MKKHKVARPSLRRSLLVKAELTDENAHFIGNLKSENKIEMV